MKSTKPPPRFLYRYYPPSGVIALATATIRFTQAADLNDPFEMRLPLFKPIADGHRLLSAASHEQLRRHLDSNWGVLCLTEVPDSLLMWSHYAQAHTGFVVAFDLNQEYFKSLNRPVRVRYSRHRPIIDKWSADTIVTALSSKGHAWRYEQEWRILSTLSKCRRLRKRLYVRELDLRAVAAIYLGLACTPDTRRRIERAVKRVSHIRLLKARLDSLSYSLTFDERLDDAALLVVRPPLAGNRRFTMRLPEQWVGEFVGGSFVFRELPNAAASSPARVLPNKRSQPPKARRLRNTRRGRSRIAPRLRS